MNDMLDDINWAPPRLSTNSMPTVSDPHEETWEGTPITHLGALEGVHGFRAAYLIDFKRRQCSAVVGERRLVDSAQTVVAVAAAQLAGFDHLALILEDLHILVRPLVHTESEATVLVIDRFDGNPVMAMAALKKLCDSLAT